MTEKVYYENPYLKTIQAKVVSVDGESVVLDRTICYPEGGGQPGDRGMIDSCRLLDTQKGEDGAIVHKVESPTFRAGDVVTVNLDWPHRYFYMRVHTAQHIASGLLYRNFGIGTLSVHDGERILTIETDRRSVDEEECYRLEDEVNEAIREGKAVHYREMDRESAEAMGLRRSIKVRGKVRLVVIDDVDVIACGGLHVASTREVGLFQYTGQESIRGHVRLIFRVAENALDEIRTDRAIITRLLALHSAQRDTLLDVETQKEAQFHAMKTENNRLREELCREKLSSLNGIVTWDVTDEPFSLKDIAVSLREKDLALLACRRKEGRLFWLMAFLGSYRSFDFNARRSALLAPIRGKGGGRPPLYQGMGEGEPETLFAVFRDVVGQA